MPTLEPPTYVGGFFLLQDATGILLNARRHRHFLGYASVAILGLPGKKGNANTEAPTVQSGLCNIVLMGQSFIVCLSQQLLGFRL